MRPNQQAALLMVGSMAFFTINDAFMKFVGATIPLAQALGLRGALATVLIFLLCVALQGLRFDLTRLDWMLIGARALTEIGAAFFFLSALFRMPIANVTAVLQVVPLVVSLGAWLVFRERLGWRRILAILLGFVGVLLIVKPGLAGFSVWSVYALVAVVCVTARDLVTRKMSADVSSLTVTFVTAVMVTLVFGGFAMTQEWTPMRPLEWASLLGATVFIVGAYYCSVQVMRVGEITVVAPFRYTALLWALVLGFLFFGEWPDALTVVGAMIIVAAGLFSLHRENLRRNVDPDVFD